MSGAMGKTGDAKKWPPTVDGIPINELPITYGRLGGPSLEVKVAVSTYVRIKNAKEKLKRYCIF